MAVRNFFLTAQVDGRASVLSGGPRAKGGEMSVRLHQRAHGGIELAFFIECHVLDAGKIDEPYLKTVVRDTNGQEVASFTTTR